MRILLLRLVFVLLLPSNVVEGWVTTTTLGRTPSVSTTTPYRSTTAIFHTNNNKRKKKKKVVSSGGGGGFGSKPSGFPYAGTVVPGTQSPQRVVTDPRIVQPDYAKSGIPKNNSNKLQLPWMIEVKSAAEIAHMRAAGTLARHVLDTAGRAVAPGVTTDEIDTIVHDTILENGAYPSPLNYHGFPKSCCTSVNEVICHGIPDSRRLEEGDMINLDITVYLDGFHGDCSEMFVVGDTLDEDGKQLIQTTYDAWIQACKYVQPGRDYKELGAIIEDAIAPFQYGTVRQFCGHGIGRTFHTNPNILHYRNNEPNGSMAVGHTFTIEPMICEKSASPLSWPDGWTATTTDGKRSSQFEHTLLITETGVEALTGKTEDSPLQFWEANSKVHAPGIWLGTTEDAISRHNAINAKLLPSSSS